MGLCRKSNKSSAIVLKYWLMHRDDGEMIAASVGWVNFYMPVKSEGDMDTFLGIARSYKVEKCDD